MYIHIHILLPVFIDQFFFFQCDQPKEGVVNNPARMDDYCRERGFSGWFETSAKENINIDEASRFLVNKVCLTEVFVNVFFMGVDVRSGNLV